MQKVFFVLISTCFLLSTFIGHASDSTVVRRAAFDFGSGSIKMQVSDVDITTNTIVHTYLKTNIGVYFQGDLLSHPESKAFSAELIQKTMLAMELLKQQAIDLGAVQFSGFSTEAFRIATNSQELFDKINAEFCVPVKLISQQEEGRLGFYTAAIMSEMDPGKIVVWDIGAGSFQINAEMGNTVEVVKALWGVVSTQNFICELLSQELVNPLSLENFQKAVSKLSIALPELPDSIREKLKQSDITVIGIGAHSKWIRKDGAVYTVEILEKTILDNLNKSEEEIGMEDTTGSYIMSSSIVNYAAMKKYGLSSVKYIRTGSGSSAAVLVDPLYW
jgi:exopolyphosphatase/guanosine-5'-triphosphate,3'-diphosphate pyrophosphatase